MIVFVLLPEGQRTETRKHHYSHIECDVEGCGVRSPPPDQLRESHGLASLGWFIAPGQHRCPASVWSPTSSTPQPWMRTLRHSLTHSCAG